MTGLIGGCFALQIQSVVETSKELQKDTTTPYDHAYGKIVKVETWKAEPKRIQLSEIMTLTLSEDRIKVTFEDGRVKKMLGFPKKPLITNKDVVVIWAKYDIFLDCVLAEDYKEKKDEDKKLP